jgi:superfamily I DNA and/or RNA helicase
LTSKKSFGVITFYRSQKQCIIRKRNEAASRVEVNIVDNFQGKGKDIIIISCVRASQALKNFGGGIGFISSKQRINVAITRPKETLIVCGHFPTMQTDEIWRSLINNAERRHFAHDVSS